MRVDLPKELLKITGCSFGCCPNLTLVAKSKQPRLHAPGTIILDTGATLIVKVFIDNVFIWQYMQVNTTNMTIPTTTIPAVIRPDRSFLDYIESRSKITASTCFQCQKCSAGCPMTYAMDYYPHQVIRMLQLGLRDELLSSKAIWVCTSCETCVTRCPNGIDIPRLMDRLKQVALAEGAPVPAEEKTLPIIHRAFLDNIQQRGRIHELHLIASYKFKTGKLLEDMRLGWEMFKRGKLKIIPPRTIRGIKAFQRLFKK